MDNKYGTTIGGNKWVRVHGMKVLKPANTNAKFAEEDTHFKRACENVGIKPTCRQASKWRNKKGKAFLGK